MRTVKIAIALGLLLSTVSGTVFAQAQQSGALNIDQVLRATNNATAKDRRANSARENRFKTELNKQKGRHNSMRNERVRQERISDELERQYEVNDAKLQKMQEELAKELGDLKQLFGVIQLSASEAREDYLTSLTSAGHRERADDLQKMVEKMASLTDLVSIDEIENLWVQLQTEMTEQGKVVQFSAPVNYVTGYEEGADGKPQPIYETKQADVTRIGVFNAVAGDSILNYDNKLGLVALERKMGGDFAGFSKGFQGASSGVSTFMVDPVRGALLNAFVKKPSITEKLEEGGVIGYVIIVLGAIALVIAVLRYLTLIGVDAAVRRQAKDLKRASLRNPLGRIMKVYQDNPKTEPESLELKLGEAMLKESPKINRWVMFVKIVAVVAPLLGLLGTVTGMIQTFQAITLFGAGDPQTMAGGISQALVTTVLGLVIAVPCVFAHWLVSGRAKRIENTLEEHVTGLVAHKYEKLSRRKDKKSSRSQSV